MSFNGTRECCDGTIAQLVKVYEGHDEVREIQEPGVKTHAGKTPKVFAS